MAGQHFWNLTLIIHATNITVGLGFRAAHRYKQHESISQACYSCVCYPYRSWLCCFRLEKLQVGEMLCRQS